MCGTCLLKDHIMVFSVTLTKKAMYVMTFNTGRVSSGHRVHLLASIPFGLMLLPVILVYSKEHSLPFHIQTRKWESNN